MNKEVNKSNTAPIDNKNNKGFIRKELNFKVFSIVCCINSNNNKITKLHTLSSSLKEIHN